MDLAAINLESDVVEAQLAAYADHHDRASTAIKSALAALQAGQMVVDLRTVFHEAMFEVRERRDTTYEHAREHGGTVRTTLARATRTTPSVAIAPAHHAGHQLRLTVRGSGDLIFQSGVWQLRVPQTVRTAGTRRVLDRWVERVPETPAYIRKQPGDLLLWEASWTSVPRSEFDPALLEHLDGWLYLVREVWDLTDVERGVLA
ncbi:hypothetical protein [Egicoccus sp. AB-alg2]|uniref:hypothetical protein n=1 Tax=Egicoccus sp. AB-alg2 TaxID=3242693 RepID=UPI00359D795A